jgi:hypothetical protein
VTVRARSSVKATTWSTAVAPFGCGAAAAEAPASAAEAIARPSGRSAANPSTPSSNASAPVRIRTPPTVNVSSSPTAKPRRAQTARSSGTAIWRAATGMSAIITGHRRSLPHT